MAVPQTFWASPIPRPRLADDPDRVGLINHEKGIVLVCQERKAGQVRKVPILAVRTLGAYECTAMRSSKLGEQPIERLQIIVTVGTTSTPQTEVLPARSCHETTHRE